MRVGLFSSDVISTGDGDEYSMSYFLCTFQKILLLLFLTLIGHVHVHFCKDEMSTTDCDVCGC